MAYVALLDASVLHPWVVCELLLRLAERGLHSSRTGADDNLPSIRAGVAFGGRWH